MDERHTRICFTWYYQGVCVYNERTGMVIQAVGYLIQTELEFRRRTMYLGVTYLLYVVYEVGTKSST